MIENDYFFCPNTGLRWSLSKRVCQNRHILFFLSQSPDFLKPGLCYVVKFLYLCDKVLKNMAKIHFRPYTTKQILLFPQRIDENIAEDDPVRLVNGLIDNLDLTSFRKLYKEYGRSPFHPRMMLKAVIYGYMNNVYSCRRIEERLLRDVHFIWLAGYEKPDFATINRFRNRVKKEINAVFTQVVLLLAERGFVSLDVEYIDGTKIESKANRYTFVWRKTVEKNRAKLLEKIRVLLEQIDDVIAQDNASEQEKVEFTPELLHSMASELNAALAVDPKPVTKEEKEKHKQRKKQAKELQEKADKLAEYDEHLEKLGERNSYSKTDPDATFMRLKEDAMNNGQTKPAYNLQIGTENQFITDFMLFPNPTDTLTMIPFFSSYSSRYDRLPKEGCADAGYGSEENYEYMEANAIEAFVKYNYFHKEQKKSFKDDIFRIENLYYNKEGDYFVCPMGQHMERVGTRHNKTEKGYRTLNAVYRAQRCEGCPLRWGCYKKRQGNREIEANHRLMDYKQRARERLTSEKGLIHRSNRPIEPEAVFGQMKYDMQYKRFRHFGKDKVFMDFAFFATAFNIKKMIRTMKRVA